MNFIICKVYLDKAVRKKKKLYNFGQVIESLSVSLFLSVKCWVLSYYLISGSIWFNLSFITPLLASIHFLENSFLTWFPWYQTSWFSLQQRLELGSLGVWGLAQLFTSAVNSPAQRLRHASSYSLCASDVEITQGSAWNILGLAWAISLTSEYHWSKTEQYLFWYSTFICTHYTFIFIFIFSCYFHRSLWRRSERMLCVLLRSYSGLQGFFLQLPKLGSLPGRASLHPMTHQLKAQPSHPTCSTTVEGYPGSEHPGSLQRSSLNIFEPSFSLCF